MNKHLKRLLSGLFILTATLLALTFIAAVGTALWVAGGKVFCGVVLLLGLAYVLGEEDMV